ncbi:DNA-dependent helicase II [Achromatium sp. WMS3]|nr:DNA-dependent helicase II [Achromatium sp. WMS3]
MKSILMDQLNPAQQEAVCAPLRNILVLAGAGSGKTRVLVHRIAWLIQQHNVKPESIFAVTFTNKAARELKERIEKLLEKSLKDMWVGTFHGLAHRFLRIHAQAADLPKTFQILDSDDQLRLIKRTHHTLKLDTNNWPPRKSQWFINLQKDEGKRPEHLSESQPKLVEIYSAYQELCNRSGLVDFAELLLRSYEVLKNNSKIRTQYQKRFQHLLVDEFQDTNSIQYAWLQLLNKNHLFVVGDDDQAIYGWRGARVENLQTLQTDRPDTLLIRLEQNYRSTGNILEAANNVITYNNTRLKKTLWTQSEAGKPVEVYRAFNEIEEARFIAERIQRFVANGHTPSETAVLYRTTAQSQVFEEALRLIKLPYRVYGGLRFFDRVEIKDTLAYLRLIANTNDDTALERIANTPPRGVGSRTIDTLRRQAYQRKVSIWDMVAQSSRPALQTFVQLIKQLQTETKGLALDDIIKTVIRLVDLPQYYKNFRDNSGPDRLENLNELINVGKRFAEKETDELESFIAYTALEMGETNHKSGDTVQLMTLHAAKGLEFPYVFIAGMEEGLFPHKMNMHDPKLLEEERRLCYVGITRAMQQIYLTHSRMRRMYGTATPTIPSQFLNQIQHPQTATPQSEAISKFKVGDKVTHTTFGSGLILALEGWGDRTKVQIAFKSNGTKWLMLTHANLTLDL